MNIVLTEEGKKAVDRAGGLDDRDTERLFDCFSEEEKEQFKQYLERLEQAIIGQLDPEHAKEYTTRGERQEGPFHGEGPQGPFCGGFGRGPANDEDEFRRRFGRRR